MAIVTATPAPAPGDTYGQIAGSLFEHAYRALEKGHFAYAVEQLLTCCHLQPGNRLFRTYLRIAGKRLRLGSHCGPLSFASHKLRFLVAQRSGKHEKVLEQGEQLLLRWPQDAPTHLGMARAAAALGDAELAVWLLEHASGPSGSRARFKRELARLHEERGDLWRATLNWDAVRKDQAANAEAGHKARDLATEATIADGQYGQSVDGTLPERNGKPGPVPDGPRLNPAQERREREAAAWRERIAAQPAEPDGYIQLAALYRRANLPERARQVLHEGLEATGHAAEVAFELDDLRLERLRRRLSRWEQQLRSRAGNRQLQQWCERLRKRINASELDLYRRKAAHYPLEAGYGLEWGVRLFWAGRLDEAIRELQRARTDPRQRWRALLHLGLCFRLRSNWPLAQRNFKAALQVLPEREGDTRKDILFHLAQGAAVAGDLGEAIEKGLELANLDYHYRGIHQLLDSWTATRAAGKRGMVDGIPLGAWAGGTA